MAYILDIAVVLIVAITIYLGYRRGFMRTMIQLVGCVAALMLAFSFSRVAAEFVYNEWVHDGLYKQIETAWETTVLENSVESINEQVNSVVDALPGFVQSMIDKELIATKFQASGGLEQTSEMVATYLTDEVIHPLAITVLRFLAFLILFLLFWLLVCLIARLLKPLHKIALIRHVDRLLGALLGAAKGLVFALIAVTVVQLLIVAGVSAGPISREHLNNSIVAGWLAENNPVATVINLE